MIEIADLHDFDLLVERRFGHGQDPLRAAERSQVLESRMRATGVASYAAYSQLLGSSSAEWQALAPLLTVPETYFFRLPDQFEALCGAVLPALLRSRAPLRRLRLLSAGCASGEEAFTMRMLLNERFHQLAAVASARTAGTAPGERREGVRRQEDAWQVDIDGFDLSARAIERGLAGLFSEWSLRGTSPARQAVNFTREDKSFRLRPQAMAGVSLRLGNLLEPPAPAEPQYDVIFCRNVLIYFSDASVQRAIQHLTERLAPGGYLFLGPAESLRGLTRNYKLCQTHDVFYYQRRENLLAEDEPAPGGWGSHRATPDGLRAALPGPRPAAPPVAEPKHVASSIHDAGVGAVPSAEAPADEAKLPASSVSAEDAQRNARLGASWFEAIRISNERVARLSQSGGPARAAGQTSGGPRSASSRTAPSRPAARASATKRPDAKPASVTAPTPTPTPETPGQPLPGAEFLSLVRRERFSDALALADARLASPDATLRRGARLLRASMLFQLGRLGETAADCTLMLEQKDASAGALYLRGLCQEQNGESAEAEKSMTQATRIDPAFAMPRLRRGLLARQRGDRGTARRAFQDALSALAGETEERLVLFAGGLSRDSLRDLCVAELNRLGAA